MRYLYGILGIVIMATVCNSAQAQQWVDDCGIIYEGVEAGCVLIRLDHYGNWLIAGDLGPYDVGDRVRVSGMLDPDCFSICMEGDGCIYIESIGPCQSYLCGDANGDNRIDIGDAVFIVDYCFRGGPAPYPISAGDFNSDGGIDVGDAVYMIYHLFRDGPPADCE